MVEVEEFTRHKKVNVNEYPQNAFMEKYLSGAAQAMSFPFYSSIKRRNFGYHIYPKYLDTLST